jgi:hypothetical protein
VKHLRLKHPAIAAAICAALSAGGVVAASAAGSGGTSHTGSSAPAGVPGPHGGGGFAVHAEEVVPNKGGTAFITQTEDNGTVVSVSGDQLTIKEGTKSLAYKTVTLTIPSGATISRNGTKAALTDFKAGDRVRVTSSSDGTSVFGGDKAPQGGPGRHGGGPPPSGVPYGG